MVLRKSFYIHWSAGRFPQVHEVNPGRDPSQTAVDGRVGVESNFEENREECEGEGVKL